MAQATRKKPTSKAADPIVSARITAQSHFRTLRFGTPFQPRIDALAKTQDWYNWAGYRAPYSLWDEELEYFAIRSQAALFDISPMTKYRVEGPGAEAFLDRVTLRDVTKLKPGRVHYTAWCDDEGFVLDDGTLFRLSPTRFRLCFAGTASAVAARQRHRFRGDRRGRNRGRRRACLARPDILRRAARCGLHRNREAESL